VIAILIGVFLVIHSLTAFWAIKLWSEGRPALLRSIHQTSLLLLILSVSYGLLVIGFWDDNSNVSNPSQAAQQNPLLTNPFEGPNKFWFVILTTFTSFVLVLNLSSFLGLHDDDLPVIKPTLFITSIVLLVFGTTVVTLIAYTLVTNPSFPAPSPATPTTSKSFIQTNTESLENLPSSSIIDTLSALPSTPPTTTHDDNNLDTSNNNNPFWIENSLSTDINNQISSTAATTTTAMTTALVEEELIMSKSASQIPSMQLSPSLPGVSSSVLASSFIMSTQSVIMNVTEKWKLGWPLYLTLGAGCGLIIEGLMGLFASKRLFFPLLFLLPSIGVLATIAAGTNFFHQQPSFLVGVADLLALGAQIFTILAFASVYLLRLKTMDRANAYYRVLLQYEM